MYAIMLFGSDVLSEVGRESVLARQARGGDPQSSRFCNRPGVVSSA